MHKKLLKEYFSHLTILYVEDEVEVRELICSWLRRTFTHVVEAKDGEEALEYYKNESFDLVITDISMPKMDGVTMAKAIKKINPEQQIIVISGHKESDFLFDLLEIGIDAYLMKPIDITLLLQTLWDTPRQVISMRQHCKLDAFIKANTDKHVC